MSLDSVDFVRADIRSPVIAKVLGEAGVDTVVHMGVLATPRQAGGRSAMKEINVIGTMQLLAACQKTASVSSFIVKSTSSVYGCGPKDPAMFTEETEPRHTPTSGWAKDSVEVEGYVRSFSRRRPDVCVTTLRFANFIGPVVRTPMTSYFGLPVIPTVLGFDARLQFVHERKPGTFNVAGDGVITLSQAIRRAGKRQAPVPQFMFSTIGRNLSRTGVVDFSPEQIRFMTYGRVLDTSAYAETFSHRLNYSTQEAFADFAHRDESALAEVPNA
jgi:UDP-glucose 4-epimerase